MFKSINLIGGGDEFWLDVCVTEMARSNSQGLKLTILQTCVKWVQIILGVGGVYHVVTSQMHWGELSIAETTVIAAIVGKKEKAFASFVWSRSVFHSFDFDHI